MFKQDSNRFTANGNCDAGTMLLGGSAARRIVQARIRTVNNTPSQDHK